MSGTRIRHPILRLDVIGPGGDRRSEHRVFCRRKGRSVPVGTCASCVRCDAIVAEPLPAVVCTPALDESTLAPDPLGVRTPVGGMLQEGTIAIDPDTTVREALGLLRSEDRRSVAVVDEKRAILGVVHEAAFLRRGLAAPRDEDVAHVMSGTIAIHEAMPIRRAVELLATAHLREATVIDDDGVPIGRFRDVDGLRWLTRARGVQAAGSNR
jgi:CBS domain-containing protein